MDTGDLQFKSIEDFELFPNKELPHCCGDDGGNYNSAHDYQNGYMIDAKICFLLFHLKVIFPTITTSFPNYIHLVDC